MLRRSTLPKLPLPRGSAAKRRLALALAVAAVLLLLSSGGDDYIGPPAADDSYSSMEATGHIRALVAKAVAEAEAEEAKAEVESGSGSGAAGEKRGALSRLASGLASAAPRLRIGRGRTPPPAATDDESGGKSGRRRDGGGGRPAMHTFYRRVDDGSTGMSASSDVDLLTAWASAWHRAGWEPVILTMRDVRRHPDYEKRRAFLDADGWGPYNSVCFWRWFAMAAEDGEGGWMADYDAFPLNSFAERTGENLPNGGNLTVHEGPNTPSLVSGTRSEYDRIAAAIFLNAEERYEKNGGGTLDTLWSDMHALGDLLVRYQRGEVEARERPFHVSKSAVSGKEFFKMAPFNEDKCEELRRRDAVAVHFAHGSLKWAVDDAAEGPLHGKMDKVQVIERRAEVCQEWVDEWRAKCGEEEESPLAEEAAKSAA